MPANDPDSGVDDLDEETVATHKTALGPHPLRRREEGSTTDRASVSSSRGSQVSLGSELTSEIGSYELIEEVGRGGMGIVYRARHVRLDRIVALKILPRTLTVDPAVLERFKREMRAIGQLDHPHVVRAFDAGEVKDLAFLAMEFVEGTTLSKIVRENGPLPVPMACDYVRQAALALDYVHQQGRVHRDVKPGNLMVTPEGVVKLADLGLARLVEERSGNEELTLTQQSMGTPDYMAPEQWSDVKNSGPAADLYSLGCTLFFVLTGRAPFAVPEFDSYGKKLLAHVNTAPPDVRTLRPDVPARLARGLARLLAKDAADRPQTGKDVATFLAEFCGEETRPAVPSSLGRPETRPFPKTAVMGLAISLLVVLVGGGAWWGVQNDLRARASSSTLSSSLPAPPDTISQQPDVADGTNPAPAAGSVSSAAPASVNLAIHWQEAAEKQSYRVLTPGNFRLKDGDKVQIHVTLSEPGYTAVYWFDAQGVPTRLWPQAVDEQARVQSLVSPPQRPESVAKNLADWHVLGGDHGLECVVAISSAQPFTAEELQRLESTRLSIHGPGPGVGLPNATAWLQVDEPGVQKVDRDLKRRLVGVTASEKQEDFARTLSKDYDQFEAWVLPHE